MVANPSRIECEVRALQVVVTKVAAISAITKRIVLRTAQLMAGSGDRNSETNVRRTNAHIGRKWDGRFGLRGFQTIHVPSAVNSRISPAAIETSRDAAPERMRAKMRGSRLEGISCGFYSIRKSIWDINPT